MSLKTIIEGYSNLISATDEVKKVARQRKNICDACPLSEFGKSRFCKISKGGCGCYLPAKRAALSEECPQQKWLAHEPVHKEV